MSQPSVWQPMETAPRTGVEILLRTAIGVVSAWYCEETPDPGGYHSCGDGGEPAAWVCYDDAFTLEVEEYNDPEAEKIVYYDHPSIKGWMPIPE